MRAVAKGKERSTDRAQMQFRERASRMAGGSGGEENEEGKERV